MDKHNNIENLSNEELLKLCSDIVENHESTKNRIIELTLELETRHNELYDAELQWVNVITELNKRNNGRI